MNASESLETIEAEATVQRLDMRDVLSARDARTLEQRLGAAARAAGFQWYSGMSVLERSPGVATLTHVHSLPPGWIDFYHAPADVVEACPVLRHVKSSDIPLCWGPRLYGATKTLNDMYHRQTKYGLSAGVAFAVHLPRGVHVVLGFDTDDTSWLADPARVGRSSSAIVQIASGVQDSMLQVLANLTPSLPQEVDLERGERDLLSWTLDGLSTLEVQARAKKDARQILAQFATITSKLRSTNKWHAAARAFQAGVIA